MSRPSWRVSLKNALALAKKTEPGFRLAIVGVGNELRGDDAAGCLVARRLLKSWVPPNPDVLIVDSGSVPENYTGVLRRFKPHMVLFIDAAMMGEPNGTISWVDLEKLQLGGFTHGLPLRILASFLHYELGSWIGLIAIQGEEFSFDTRPTLPVRNAIQRLTICLRSLTLS